MARLVVGAGKVECELLRVDRRIENHTCRSQTADVEGRIKTRTRLSRQGWDRCVCWDRDGDRDRRSSFIRTDPQPKSAGTRQFVNGHGKLQNCFVKIRIVCDACRSVRGGVVRIADRVIGQEQPIEIRVLRRSDIVQQIVVVEVHDDLIARLGEERGGGHQDIGVCAASQPRGIRRHRGNLFTGITTLEDHIPGTAARSGYDDILRIDVRQVVQNVFLQDHGGHIERN